MWTPPHLHYVRRSHWNLTQEGKLSSYRWIYHVLINECRMWTPDYLTDLSPVGDFMGQYVIEHPSFPLVMQVVRAMKPGYEKDSIPDYLLAK